MKVQKKLLQILKSSGFGPFLFIGSGISRRYLGLETWEKLLRNFCTNIKEFEYYRSSANSDLPYTASLMADDYKDMWWSSNNYLEEREKFKKHVKYRSSPLKISIAEHVREISNSNYIDNQTIKNEINELKKVNIDGIITTNWDLLSENLFADYKIFVGQEELLVSTPQNIGEIYKIHGCCTRPNSLILTKEDYKHFEESNPYLAAKLVTIFVENPVIFMGYSLFDPNIKALLSSIVKGIGKKNIKKITNNLIFVQREKEGRKYGVRETVYSLGKVDLPVTLVVTSDFSEIYKALQLVEHKIPARILRHCKKQVYNLVKETNPSERLCVIDFDDIDDSSNIDFVVGIGVQERLNKKGYEGVNLIDIFKDVVLGDGCFDPETILSTTVKNCEKATKYIPVYKYLKQLGIDNIEKYHASKYSLRAVFEYKKQDFINKHYAKLFLRECKGLSVKQIVEKYESNKAVILIPYVPWKEIKIDELEKFVVKFIDCIESKNNKYPTHYRKIICIYDILKNGWYLD